LNNQSTGIEGIDAAGWLLEVTRAPSPNYNARPLGIAVELVVVHSISLPPGEYGGDAVLDFFGNRLDCNAHPYYAGLRGVEVSAHCFIRRDGQLIQCVSFDDRAWHAGVSRWNGRERCNDYSIGIELEGTDLEPFTDVQYARLRALMGALRTRYPLRAVVGHSDVAPARKSDPGVGFDWRRLSESR
jgi:N-acetyl-anhydromuramoyl-L-alanine amidase